MVPQSSHGLDSLPIARGIYQITAGRISYVGLSSNIRSRIYRHLESRSCRSRIILDTGRARVVVLELLPHASDRLLAEREWYWFDRLQRQGHVLVNDPQSLGRTASGRYGPPPSVPATGYQPDRQSPPWTERLASCWWLAVTAVVILGFGSGYLAMQHWLRWQMVATTPRPSDRRPSPPSLSSLEIPSLEDCWQPLKRGDRGDAVRTLQLQLQQLGLYDETVDGLFGRGTQRAVAAFQRQQRLTISAVVGCDTQRALQAAIAAGNGPTTN